MEINRTRGIHHNLIRISDSSEKYSFAMCQENVLLLNVFNDETVQFVQSIRKGDDMKNWKNINYRDIVDTNILGQRSHGVVYINFVPSFQDDKEKVLVLNGICDHEEYIMILERNRNK